MSSRIKIKLSSGRAASDQSAGESRALRVNNTHWWNKVPFVSDIVSAIWKSWSNPTFKSDRGAARNDAWKLSDETRYMNEISDLLEKTQERQNWNFFVGHERFRTNFFLQFLCNTTAKMYEAQVISGSLYSIRIWLIIEFALVIKCFQTLNHEESKPQSEESESFQLFVAISFFILSFLASFEKQWSIQNRQLCMNSMTTLLELFLIRSYQSHQDKLPKSAYLRFMIELGILLPAFITNILIVANWTKFLFIILSQLALVNMIYILQKNSGYDITINMARQIALYTFCFAIIEKIQKERFVINLTNQYQRKLFAEVINSGCASVIIEPDGKITFFNDVFKRLLTDKLYYQSLPSNIYKLFEDDPTDMQQLQELITVTLNCKNNDQQKTFDPRKFIELRAICKKQPEIVKIDAGDGFKTNRSFLGYEKEKMKIYEMLRISCRVSNKSANKSLILNLQCILDYRMHAHLICEQSFYLQSFLSRFQNGVENKIKQDLPKTKNQLIENLKQESGSKQELMNDPVILLSDSLGNAPQLLYCLGQIQFQVEMMTIMGVTENLWDAEKQISDFSLQDCLTKHIEQCSNLCADHPPVTLNCDDSIPDVVNGDADMLMLAVQTFTEFTLRYTSSKMKNKNILINTSFDQMLEDERSMLVSIQFRMPVNSAYDIRKIRRLFSEMLSDDAYQNDEIQSYFLMRMLNFGEYFEEFGVGLLLLPALIYMLRGKVTTKLITANKDKRTLHSIAQQRHSAMIDLDQVSMMSGRSFITTNEAAVDSQSAEQNLIVKLSVPLNQPDHNNDEERKKPMIIPSELTNRIENGRITTWISPKLHRMKQLMVKTKSEMDIAEQGQPHFLDLSEPGVQIKHTSQTPQIQMRQINHLMLTGSKGQSVLRNHCNGLAAADKNQGAAHDQATITEGTPLHLMNQTYHSQQPQQSKVKDQAELLSNKEGQKSLNQKFSNRLIDDDDDEDNDKQEITSSQLQEALQVKSISGGTKQATTEDSDKGFGFQSSVKSQDQSGGGLYVRAGSLRQRQSQKSISPGSHQSNNQINNAISMMNIPAPNQIVANNILSDKQNDSESSQGGGGDAPSVKNILKGSKKIFTWSNENIQIFNNGGNDSPGIECQRSESAMFNSLKHSSPSKGDDKEIAEAVSPGDQLMNQSEQNSNAEQQREASNDDSSILRNQQQNLQQHSSGPRPIEKLNGIISKENEQFSEGLDIAHVANYSSSLPSQGQQQDAAASSPNYKNSIGQQVLDGSNENSNPCRFQDSTAQIQQEHQANSLAENSLYQQKAQAIANEDHRSVGQQPPSLDIAQVQQQNEEEKQELNAVRNYQQSQQPQSHQEVTVQSQLDQINEVVLQPEIITNNLNNDIIEQEDQNLRINNQINQEQYQQQQHHEQRQVIEEEKKENLRPQANRNPGFRVPLGAITEEEEEEVLAAAPDKDDGEDDEGKIEEEQQENEEDQNDLNQIDIAFNVEENKKADSDNHSENMGTVFIDEMLPGSNLDFLTNKGLIQRVNKRKNEASQEIDQNGVQQEAASVEHQPLQSDDNRQQNYQGQPQQAFTEQQNEQFNFENDDFDDDEEPVLTEEQKEDLSQRRKLILAEYRAKLRGKMEEEKMRSQEILRQKQLENLEEQKEVALVKMRLDDHLGGNGVNKGKIEKKGASRSQLQQQKHAQLAKLSQPNQPEQLRRQRQERQQMMVPEERNKLKLQQAIRQIKRSINESRGKTDANKRQHRIRRPNLTVIMESEQESASSSVFQQRLDSRLLSQASQFSEQEDFFSSDNNQQMQQQYQQECENPQPRLLVNQQAIFQQRMVLQDHQQQIIQEQQNNNDNQFFGIQEEQKHMEVQVDPASPPIDQSGSPQILMSPLAPRYKLPSMNSLVVNDESDAVVESVSNNSPEICQASMVSSQMQIMEEIKSENNEQSEKNQQQNDGESNVERGIQVLQEISEYDFSHMDISLELKNTLGNAKKLIGLMRQQRRHQSQQEMPQRNNECVINLQLASQNDSLQNDQYQNNENESSNNDFSQQDQQQIMNSHRSFGSKCKSEDNNQLLQSKSEQQLNDQQNRKNNNGRHNQLKNDKSIDKINFSGMDSDLDEQDVESVSIDQQNLSHIQPRFSDQIRRQNNSSSEGSNDVQHSPLKAQLSDHSGQRQQTPSKQQVKDAFQLQKHAHDDGQQQNPQNQIEEEKKMPSQPRQQEVMNKQKLNQDLIEYRKRAKMQEILIKNKHDSLCMSNDLQQIKEECSIQSQSSPLHHSGSSNSNQPISSYSSLPINQQKKIKPNKKISSAVVGHLASKDSLVEEVKQVIEQEDQNVSEEPPCNIDDMNKSFENNSFQMQNERISGNIILEESQGNIPSLKYDETCKVDDEPNILIESSQQSQEDSKLAIVAERSHKHEEQKSLPVQQPQKQKDLLRIDSAPVIQRRRQSIRVQPRLPRRTFKNRYMLSDKCQKRLGPDNYFIQNRLLEEEQQLAIAINKDPIKWNLPNSTDINPSQQPQQDQEDEN